MQMPSHVVGLLAVTALVALAVPVLEFPSQLQDALQDATQAADDAAANKRRRLKDDAADFWIYDDLYAAEAKAKTTGKPLLVSFRCVP